MNPTTSRVSSGNAASRLQELSAPPPFLPSARAQRSPPPSQWPGQRDDFDATPPPDAKKIEQLSADELATLSTHTFLKIGCHGEQVKELQKLLGIEESGEFDQVTEAAVMAYQTAHQLRPDGTVGQQTWAALLNIPGVLPGTWHLAAQITVTVESFQNRGQSDQMALGAITINGHTYRYRNGGFGRGNAPNGDYEVTPHLWERDEPAFSVDGVGWSFAVSDKYDPRVGDTRTLLRIHPDGGTPGTHGCWGIVGNGEVQKRFREDMRAVFAQSGNVLLMRVGS